MKKYMLLLLLPVSFVMLHAQEAPPASGLLDMAKRQAVMEHKNVFVIFHASWCIWCHKMDSSINDPLLKSYFDKNYVFTHLTILESRDKKSLENPGAYELYAQYAGKEGQGIPFWLVFDKEGKLLADSQLRPGVNSGCPATMDEVDYFIGVLKRTSTITPELVSLVEKRFRKNE